MGNVNFCYIPMSKLKTTSIEVYIHTRLDKENVSKNALLPYVLKRGCRLCPSNEEVAKYLENLCGAALSGACMKMGDDQLIHLGFKTISDKYAPGGECLTADGAELLFSILFEPTAFDEETVKREKKNAVDRIMAEINEKRVYAMRRCGEIMCEGDPFALSPLGTVEGIKAITAKSLEDYYKKLITSAVVDIYVCGEADMDALKTRFGKYTENFSFTPSEIPKSTLFKGGSNVKTVTDKMDVTQGKLSMGFSTGIKPTDADYPALMVMNSIYGGGAHSKLFNNVREKLSLCYYASSNLVREKGIMFVNAGVEFENFQKAQNEIMAQLETTQRGDISDLEFTSSIKDITSRLEAYKDDQQLMTLYSLINKVSGTTDAIDELKDKISRVTIDDVIRVSKNVKLDTVYMLTGKEDA